MKKLIIITVLFSTALSCKNDAVKKPANLIEKDKMMDIIYDIALLEAIKSDPQFDMEKRQINPKTYIFKKYKIDSLQYVKSNKYYAADVEEYAKMYQKVIKRIETEKAVADTIIAQKQRVEKAKLKKNNLPKLKTNTTDKVVAPQQPIPEFGDPRSSQIRK